jgi:hypothetical protein
MMIARKLNKSESLMFCFTRESETQIGWPDNGLSMDLRVPLNIPGLGIWHKFDWFHAIKSDIFIIILLKCLLSKETELFWSASLSLSLYAVRLSSEEGRNPDQDLDLHFQGWVVAQVQVDGVNRKTAQLSTELRPASE